MRTATWLALRPEFADNPNAMFVLWKDHTSIAEAEEITALCHGGRYPDYSRYIGGVYSSEWFWAKILHVSREDRAVRAAAKSLDRAVRLGTRTIERHHPPRRDPPRTLRRRSQELCGIRNGAACLAVRFLAELDPCLVDTLAYPLFTESYTADLPVGRITPEWAARLGLPESVIVSGGAFDCHMGAVGAGARDHTLVKVIGTSTCDILIADESVIGGRSIEGICGQVDGSVLPGKVGLEAGQSAFGDMYAWFSRLLGWPLQYAAQRHPELSEQLQQVQDNLLPAITEALGRKHRLPQPSGGARLVQRPAHTVRQPAAERCGDRPESWHRHADPVRRGSLPRRLSAPGRSWNASPIRACRSKTSVSARWHCAQVANGHAGLRRRDEPADRRGSRPISAARSGAAIFAAVASGQHPDTASAQQAMASHIERTYRPCPQSAAAFESLYQRYRRWCAQAEPLYAPDAAGI